MIFHEFNTESGAHATALANVGCPRFIDP